MAVPKKKTTIERRAFKSKPYILFIYRPFRICNRCSSTIIFNCLCFCMIGKKSKINAKK